MVNGVGCDGASGVGCDGASGIGCDGEWCRM